MIRVRLIFFVKKKYQWGTGEEFTNKNLMIFVASWNQKQKSTRFKNFKTSNIRQLNTVAVCNWHCSTNDSSLPLTFGTLCLWLRTSDLFLQMEGVGIDEGFVFCGRNLTLSRLHWRANRHPYFALEFCRTDFNVLLLAVRMFLMLS